jgi:phage antirepressor YoqD-like protein
MNQISINVTNGTQTMSSLEMVRYINLLRLEESPTGYKELRHADFLEKTRVVMKGGERKFSSSYKSSQNKDLQMYVFPKREAMLMAMSYSYDVQSKVYDAWTAAENLVKDVVKVSPLLPVNYIEALELLVSSEKAKVVMSIKLEEAAPKVAFHDAVVADATVYSLGDAAKLLGIGRTKFAKWLRANSYVQQNLIPYATANKFLESSFSSFVLPNGTVKAPTTYVTGVGLKHFQRKLQTTD